MNRNSKNSTVVIFVILSLLAANLLATPPVGDPNQPYDQLPGTLETYHIKWAKPSAAGKLNALFIIPYASSREIVEAAQRLDMDYNYIMCGGFAGWEKGWWMGVNSTALRGAEAKLVLNELAKKRLSLAHKYDVIVIGKVSWEVIPDYAKDLILGHVKRGAGLVYVSPNRLKEGVKSKKEAEGKDEQFQKLFETNKEKKVAGKILSGLPLDIMPVKIFDRPEDYKALPGVVDWKHQQSPLYVSATDYGQGRIICLDYFDEKVISRFGFNALSYYYYEPDGGHDKVAYDYAFAILTKAMLWAAGKESPLRASISIKTPATDLKASKQKNIKEKWKPETPQIVVKRKKIPETDIILEAYVNPGKLKHKNLKLKYMLRNRDGDILIKKEQKAPKISAGKLEQTIKLDYLPRGDYLLDLIVATSDGKVLDFASKSFRVESPFFVKELKSKRESYQPGQTIKGSVAFSRKLSKDYTATVSAVDTWDRTTAIDKLTIGGETETQSFALPVKHPLSELWDIKCAISDKHGLVDTKSAWVTIPNHKFDNFMFMLIFSPTPGLGGWKNKFYPEVIKKYGINSTFTNLIYSWLQQFEHNARANLRNVAYAQHFGEMRSPSDNYIDHSKEKSNFDLVKFSEMARKIADTGKKLDAKKFPHKFYSHYSAKFFNRRFEIYKKAAKFSSPFYVLTGENYLSGEFQGKEHSGFGPATTKKFQEWCKKEYDNNFAALNKEWNTNFKSWENVRGILMEEAVEKHQLPRWVDFRYFMRSQVWSQFFIDFTDMIRRAIPGAHTGRVGHDHHDFTRYRNHMTCSKLYIGTQSDPEWHEFITPELQNSFSNDNSFLMGSKSMLVWHNDFHNTLNRKRLPWTMLFMGLNGFDWERGMKIESLGGESCFTPDYSKALPFFEEISEEVRLIQSGIGKLVIDSKPKRSKVAVLWSPYNHYISRLLPFQENGFSGTWLYNISVHGGAPSDALALLTSIHIRPVFIGYQDVESGELKKRGFKALILPYNKGMSRKEATAIRKFVENGGLVIADNEPGTYSKHGKKLKTPLLKNLFPSFNEQNLVKYGKGHAVYLPKINSFVARHENGNYTGSDSMAFFLEKYAGVKAPFKLLDSKGVERRDVFSPVFTNGTTTLIGLLRSSKSAGRESNDVTMVLDKKYHIWDVINKTYSGYTDRLDFILDLYPKMFALLPANPETITMMPKNATVERGGVVQLSGKVNLSDGKARAAAKKMKSAVLIKVNGPQGKELEFFRQIELFNGGNFVTELPISYSAEKGRYVVTAEYVITGMKAETCFDVN